MASSVPPKGRAPPVNSGKLVELPLDNAPTMKRYLDFLANTVANNSSSSSPLDPPPALPFISSQLPPLPSFHELQKLRQELELFEQTAKGRKEHVERNIQTLDRWTPSKSLSVDGDVPTKDEKVKDAKIAEPKRKEPVKERKSKADDTVREDSRVMLKLKIAPQVPRTEKAGTQWRHILRHYCSLLKRRYICSNRRDPCT
ncbi:hypothetical protein DFS34DRAFT_452036 [Phlyctochytrium arcticum]|nr:hypothetical protein DFS34DRAFT_452036 [Phlyctochytrium arcticum]